ncbi:sensor histidine kinase [Paenibacillus thalictri]|uniref:Histidine kinase domain-containing protein n=1 Tax=Paenibacillus thalictri TaxID=2527873 RepID=A0A4Q9DLE1_9BACL|nr:histidine kinase [Paenibacillus thalictri]TBL75756.1 hypothetical protein EYB31_22490 [Paenibacillus thalictri]
MQYRQLVGIGLIFSLSIALFLAVFFQTIPSGSDPIAQRGVLDLTNRDMRQGVVLLDGEWEFYEGELLEPADFRNGGQEQMSYLNVPGTWKGKTADGGMNRKGYGTYRLKVLIRNPDDVLGLKVRSIRMSHRLFINGKLEGGSGVPTAGIEGNKPGNTPYTAFFKPDAREIEIVIQVSNFEFITGGIVGSIQLGSHAAVTKLNGIQLGTDIGTVLMLGMFGAYHLGFYFVGRRERTYFLSGLYMLFLLLEHLLYGEKILQRALPGLPFEWAYKLLDLSEFLSAAVIILFFRRVDTRLMSSRKLAVVLAPILLYIATVLLLPYRVHITFKYACFVYMAFVVCFIIGRMIYLYLKSSKASANRKELMLFIGGSFSLMVFLVNGSLYSENIVSTDLAGKFGVICFVIFMNILLAVHFSNAHEKTEILSHQLDQAQIKPHFLYNALSSVISFCYTDGVRAAHLLSMLSHYLRYILELDRSQLYVPLYRELELVEAYVEIEKARFGERFDFVLHVDEGLEHRNIPSLCIQPLVENAVRHGLFEKLSYGIVSLSILRNQDGYMEIIIKDDGIGMTPELLHQISKGRGLSGSIGIANIRNRLDLIHGAAWNVSSEVGRGTQVTMRIPLNLGGTQSMRENQAG